MGVAASEEDRLATTEVHLQSIVVRPPLQASTTPPPLGSLRRHSRANDRVGRSHSVDGRNKRRPDTPSSPGLHKRKAHRPSSCRSMLLESPVVSWREFDTKSRSKKRKPYRHKSHRTRAHRPCSGGVDALISCIPPSLASRRRLEANLWLCAALGITWAVFSNSMSSDPAVQRSAAMAAFAQDRGVEFTKFFLTPVLENSTTLKHSGLSSKSEALPQLADAPCDNDSLNSPDQRNGSQAQCEAACASDTSCIVYAFQAHGRSPGQCLLFSECLALRVKQRGMVMWIVRESFTRAARAARSRHTRNRSCMRALEKFDTQVGKSGSESANDRAMRLHRHVERVCWMPLDDLHMLVGRDCTAESVAKWRAKTCTGVIGVSPTPKRGISDGFNEHVSPINSTKATFTSSDAPASQIPTLNTANGSKTLEALILKILKMHQRVGSAPSAPSSTLPQTRASKRNEPAAATAESKAHRPNPRQEPPKTTPKVTLRDKKSSKQVNAPPANGRSPDKTRVKTTPRAQNRRRPIDKGVGGAAAGNHFRMIHKNKRCARGQQIKVITLSDPPDGALNTWGMDLSFAPSAKGCHNFCSHLLAMEALEGRFFSYAPRSTICRCYSSCKDKVSGFGNMLYESKHD